MEADAGKLRRARPGSNMIQGLREPRPENPRLPRATGENVLDRDLMSRVQAKICGLTDIAAVQAAVAGGADWLGFVFFPGSPRDVAPNRAADLVAAVTGRAKVVAVTVDPDDQMLDRIQSTLRPDLIQLHGRETPARVSEVRARTGASVVKALRVSTAEDLQAADGFADVADYLMFDAKPSAGAALPGGNGAAFDWSILAGRRFAKPWFLAGGLAPDNVEEAVRGSGAPMVDVSSGVEAAPGVKDPVLVKAFLEAVRRA
jgi:phosphoribosylanthranilate isomerase